MTKAILLLLAVLVGLYVLYFAGLGLNPLTDPDEPIYGQFVKEMVRSGDWLTPHYDGKLWFDKPPLFYWLSSLCVKCLGLNEAAVRMPSALMALLVLLVVYMLARIDFGHGAGILAGAIMATSLLQIVMSHAAATDEVMLFCMVAALYAYRMWFGCESRGRFSWMAACGVAIGLGILAKGPVVPLLLLATFACHLAWTRRLRKLISLEMLLAVIVSAVVGLPWYAAMWLLHGEVFVKQFIIANNVDRFLHPLHVGQAGHWYSHLVSAALLLLFLFPWNVFLLSALRRCDIANAGTRLLICWGAMVLVFFSLSKTQNFTYTLPIFPACAVIIGAYLHKAGEREAMRKQLVTALAVGCALSLLYGIALIITLGRKYPNTSAMGAVAAGMLLLSFAAPLAGVLSRRLSIRHAPMVTAAVMVAFAGFAINGLVPLAADSLSTKTLATKINDFPGTQVVAFRLWRPGLLYYLDRRPIHVDTPEEVRRYAATDQPTLLVCDKRNVRFFEECCTRQIIDYGRLGAYANPMFYRDYAAWPAKRARAERL